MQRINHAIGVYIIACRASVYHHPIGMVYHQGEALYIITREARAYSLATQVLACGE